MSQTLARITLNVITLGLLKAGIEFRVKIDPASGQVVWRMEDGFYKSSGAELHVVGEHLELHCRYGEVTRITSMADVVGVSFAWWNRSKHKSSFWEVPPPEWSKLYERFHLT